MHADPIKAIKTLELSVCCMSNLQISVMPSKSKYSLDNAQSWPLNNVQVNDDDDNEVNDI